MQYLKFILILICAFVQTKVQIVNFSFIDLSDGAIPSIVNSNIYLAFMTLIQFFIYIVLAKIYTKAYFYFFLYDSEIKDSEQILYNSICRSYIVFLISGILFLFFARIQPGSYELYIFGTHKDGNSINSFVMLALAFIQAIIVFFQFYIQVLKQEENINKFLRLLTLCIILLIVHLPGVIHFGGTF